MGKRNPVLEQAKQQAAAGLSVIPVKTDGSKVAAICWGNYQSEVASSERIETWDHRGIVSTEEQNRVEPLVEGAGHGE